MVQFESTTSFSTIMCEHISYNQQFDNEFPYIYRKCGTYTTMRMCPGHTSHSLKSAGCGFIAGNYICGHQIYSSDGYHEDPTTQFCYAHQQESNIPSYFMLTTITDVTILAMLIAVFTTTMYGFFVSLSIVGVLSVGRWYFAISEVNYLPRFCCYVTPNSIGNMVRCLHQIGPDESYCYLHANIDNKISRCIRTSAVRSDDTFINSDGNPVERVCGLNPEQDIHTCDKHNHDEERSHRCNVWYAVTFEIIRLVFLFLACWLAVVDTSSFPLWILPGTAYCVAEALLVGLHIRIMDGFFSLMRKRS